MENESTLSDEDLALVVAGRLICRHNCRCYLDDAGRSHRDDDPAVIWTDGTTEWRQHGKLHRVGAPAFLRIDGTEHWYQFGKLHRDDGPAIIREDGTKEFWIDGRFVKPI